MGELQTVRPGLRERKAMTGEDESQGNKPDPKPSLELAGVAHCVS